MKKQEKEKRSELPWKGIAIAAIALLLIVSILYIRKTGEEKSVMQDAVLSDESVPETQDLLLAENGIAEDDTENSGDEITDAAEEPECDPALKERIGPLSQSGYTLTQVVCLSRHNIRSPLNGPGSLLDTMTPHSWFAWTSKPSELSLKGGTLETQMGQYFRVWLEAEGFFPDKYRPEEEAVRIYANSRQRTIATANFFVTGLLPLCNEDVEYQYSYETTDAVFYPRLHYCSEEYRADAEAEIRRMYEPAIRGLSENYALLADVLDVEDSEDYENGEFSGFAVDDTEFLLKKGEEPLLSGSLKRACSLADAMVLQYYEESDAQKAAFGRDLSQEDWETIAKIKDVYGDVLFTAPLVAVNVAHPLLCEMEQELQREDRKFTFLCGHDSNVGSVLAALRVEPYDLPCSIEKKTPIGCKLVIAKWCDENGEEYFSLDLVYQTTEQLREMKQLDLTNPPAIYGLRLQGLTPDENGCYKAADVMLRLHEVIDAYYEMIEMYEEMEDDEAA